MGFIELGDGEAEQFALGLDALAVVGLLTSIKASGIPLISRVMSGRNSSSSLMQGSSVTTWKRLLSKFSKSISRQAGGGEQALVESPA